MTDLPLNADSKEILWILDGWLDDHPTFGDGDYGRDVIVDARNLLAQLHNRILEKEEWNGSL